MLAETTDKPKSPDEQNFLDKHIVDKRDHPVAPDDQFTGEIKGKKKKKRDADREEGQDKQVYEETEAEEVIVEASSQIWQLLSKRSLSDRSSLKTERSRRLT